jgi:hypothetical protein
VGSRSTGRTALALGVAAAGWVLSTNQALAQSTDRETASAAADAAEDEEELGPEAGAKRPAAPDERAGHILLQGRLGLSQPFGDVAAGQPGSRILSGGLAFGAHAGIGLSRVTVLELSGSYALLGCSDCTARSLDLGLGFAYHIAQGIAFDPWISYGVGYRRLSFSSDGPAAFDDVYHGLDVARVALGGDFYPVPSFGIGLFAELDGGTYLSRPDGGSGITPYGFFQAGVRLALDPVPRGTRRPAATAGTSRPIAVGSAPRPWRR